MDRIGVVSNTAQIKLIVYRLSTSKGDIQMNKRNFTPKEEMALVNRSHVVVLISYSRVRPHARISDSRLFQGFSRLFLIEIQDYFHLDLRVGKLWQMPIFDSIRSVETV